MPVIVFASSKGGAGKTTACVILAAELARQGKDKGIDISLIDADEAARTINLIRRQEKALQRKISYSVLFTRTNPALIPRTLKAIMGDFKKVGIDIFRCSLTDREAFRAVRSFGGTVNDLSPQEVSGIEKAVINAKEYAEEVKRKLKDSIEEVRRSANG
jgi:hypothetical protein